MSETTMPLPLPSENKAESKAIRAMSLDELEAKYKALNAQWKADRKQAYCIHKWMQLIVTVYEGKAGRLMPRM